MTACQYCRTLMDTKAERCPRCGHHRPAMMARAGAGATAPAMQLVPDAPAAKAEAALPRPSVNPAVNQTSMFRDAIPQKVVPIPNLTPLHVEEERPSRRSGPRTNPPRSRRVSEAQQALDWGDQVAQVRPEEKISCSAPVAPPPLRLIAAAVDGAAVLIGTGIIVGIYLSQGGEVKVGSGATMMLAALLALVSMLYRALWCLASGDSPGMQFAGLRLIDFDGRRPGRRQRVIRQAAGILSLCAAGVGVAWALVDDESLTWHDHISKTFPTAVLRK